MTYQLVIRQMWTTYAIKPSASKVAIVSRAAITVHLPDSLFGLCCDVRAKSSEGPYSKICSRLPEEINYLVDR
jgi:hypothetical protein